MASVTGNKEVTFVFQKKTDGSIEVVSFREPGYVEDRLLDVEHRSLEDHSALDVPEIRDILSRVTRSKTISVVLSPEQYNIYASGGLTTSYDRRAAHKTTSEATHTTTATTAAIASTPAASSSSQSSPSAPAVIQDQPVPPYLMQFMAQQNENQMRMMTEFTAALSNLTTFNRSKKMEVTKFDGLNQDARTWMLLYERACDSNGWLSDDQKINNLKASLVPSSGADRWYSSKILHADGLAWYEWKESFIAAFTQNRIEACNKALKWEYRSGSVMTYYYEKERLLQLAFPHIHEDTLITLVIHGLPSYLHAQVLAFKPEDTDDLIAALQTLVPKNSGKGGNENDSKRKHDDQRHPQHTKQDQTKVPGKAFYRPKPSGGQPPPGRHVNNIGSSIRTYVLIVNGVRLEALFDSGAECNVIHQRVLSANGWKPNPFLTAVKRFDNTEVESVSQISLIMQLPAQSEFRSQRVVVADALVMNNILYDMIVGESTLRDLGIGLTSISNVVAVSHRVASLDDVTKLFPNVLKETRDPIIEVPFALRDPLLISAKKPYRLSRDKAVKVTADIEQQLEKGWIRHSTSKFAAPIVVVMKPDKPIRICQDYREINMNTDLDPFPMPIIDDIIVNLGGCNFFTKIDLKDAFRQIGLTEETRNFTAFVTGTGFHVEHNRLPFGWKNSPPIFQRHITHVLGDLLYDPRVSVYVDDIVCGAKTLAENECLTFKILERLSDNSMTISPKKSSFNQKSVTLLGRVIDGQTRTTRQESIDKVRNMNRPVDVKSVQQFTGLTNHFRDYIPGYAAIVRPIDKPERKDVPFVWSEDCEQSFVKLVNLITSDPILSLPDWTLKFELCTDASNYGCGAVMYQRDESQPKRKQMRVIGFYSHTFTPAEVNYNVSEKEMLAVIRAIKYWRSYLEGR